MPQPVAPLKSLGNANMRGGRALLHFDDGAPDLVTCTDPHSNAHRVQAGTTNGARLLALIGMKLLGPSENLPRAYGAEFNSLACGR